MRTFEEWNIKNLFGKKPPPPANPEDQIDPYGEEMWATDGPDFFDNLDIKKTEFGDRTFYVFKVNGKKYFNLGQYHKTSNSFLFCLDLLQVFINDRDWYKHQFRTLGNDYSPIDKQDMEIIKENYLQMMTIDGGAFQGNRIIPNILRIQALRR
jgi:hypothetical protein